MLFTVVGFGDDLKFGLHTDLRFEICGPNMVSVSRKRKGLLGPRWGLGKNCLVQRENCVPIYSLRLAQTTTFETIFQRTLQA